MAICYRPESAFSSMLTRVVTVSSSAKRLTQRPLRTQRNWCDGHDGHNRRPLRQSARFSIQESEVEADESKE